MLSVILQQRLEMDVKRVIACLFVCVCVGGVVGQVGSLCRPQERLLPCGCHKTCKDPAPDCRGVCTMGCFCKEGQVRNDEGICVDLADCPPVAAPYRQLDTTEPRFQPCRPDEEYRFCEPCNRTCATPNPVCPAQCARGCFCKGDLLRDTDGRCVTFDKCSTFEDYIRERERNVAPPVLSRYSCGPNQEYKDCKKCTQSCSDLEPVCGKCKTGCFCKDGFLKGPNGKCVTREECPIAAMTPSEVQETVEDCSPNEEYYSCGWCEPTCQEPSPSCPDLCTSGCLCRQPLVRHFNGLCVSRDQCASKNCSANEEYGCRYSCELKCKPNFCVTRTRLNRRCILRCHCKKGLFRDEQERCVTKDECSGNLKINV